MSTPPSIAERSWNLPEAEAYHESATIPTGLRMPKQTMVWTPMTFDFDAAPERPEWGVEGLIPRQGVAVLSADTGACKTWAVHDLMVAAAMERPWLDRQVNLRRALVVDGENPEPVVRGRLRALGMTNERRDRLAYYCGQGILIGQRDTREQFEALIAEHQPDLLAIDTVMAATAVADVNDNNEIAELFAYVRGLVREYRLLVVMLHHERKPQQGQGGSRGHAMMGGRQWAGQSDVHLALRVAASEEEQREDGRVAGRTTLRLDMPKNRLGVPIRPQRLVLETLNEDSMLMNAQLRCEGAIEREQSATDDLLGQIINVLTRADQCLQKKDIAERVGSPAGDRSFERALKHGKDKGLLVSPKHGQYAAGAAGLASTEVPF